VKSDEMGVECFNQALLRRESWGGPKGGPPGFLTPQNSLLLLYPPD